MTEDEEQPIENEERIEAPDDSYDEWRDVCMDDFNEGLRAVVHEVVEQKHNYVSRHGEGGAWMYAAIEAMAQARYTGTLKDLYELQSYLKNEQEQLQQAIEKKQRAIDALPLPIPFSCTLCGRVNTGAWDEDRATRYAGPKLTLICKCGAVILHREEQKDERKEEKP